MDEEEPDWNRPHGWDNATRLRVEGVVGAVRVAIKGYLRNGWGVFARGPRAEEFAKYAHIPLSKSPSDNSVILIGSDGDCDSAPPKGMNYVYYWPCVEIVS